MQDYYTPKETIQYCKEITEFYKRIYQGNEEYDPDNETFAKCVKLGSQYDEGLSEYGEEILELDEFKAINDIHTASKPKQTMDTYSWLHLFGEYEC